MQVYVWLALGVSVVLSMVTLVLSSAIAAHRGSRGTTRELKEQLADVRSEVKALGTDIEALDARITRRDKIGASDKAASAKSIYQQAAEVLAKRKPPDDDAPIGPESFALG